MTTEQKRTLPIDARVVALVETSGYNIAACDKPFIDCIRGIYVYDKNTVTHCCEMTPSYYLIHVYDQVILTEAGNELNHIAQDKIFEKYEQHGESDDKYVHCRNIDKIESEATPYYYYKYGNPKVSFDDVEYDQQMESLREHFQGNCPL